MVKVVFNFLSMVVNWLVSHLPASPLANLGFVGDMSFGEVSIDTVLGWVNWLIPVGDLISLFGLWLSAIVTASAIRWVITMFVEFGTGGVLDALEH